MEKEFIIKVKMKERWINHFISFLMRLQRNGSIGHSEFVSFYSDGDGDFRPKFEIEGIEYQEVEPIKRDNEIVEINPIFIREYYDAG